MHAAEIDHTVKPPWTLANFYFRNNQPDKTQLLDDPAGFESESVGIRSHANL